MKRLLRFPCFLCLILFVVLLMTFSLDTNAGEKVFCSLCHKEISEDYIRFKDGDIYCKECMRKPKCIQCGKPTANTFKNKPLCLKCATHPNICTSCGRLLGRKFVVFPLSAGKYCHECVQELPKCRFCSAPTKERAGFGNNWPMCAECKKRAVVGIDRIRLIYAEVQSIIATNINLELNYPAALELCKNIIKEGRGMNGDEMGLMQQHGATSVVLIQDGLPLEQVYETLAHEWGHAWIAQHTRRRLSLKDEEGFCQWVASKVLLAKGYDASLNILRSRRDIYGSGYRKMEKIEIAHGVSGVVSYVQQAKIGFFRKIFGKKR